MNDFIGKMNQYNSLNNYNQLADFNPAKSQSKGGGRIQDVQCSPISQSPRGDNSEMLNSNSMKGSSIQYSENNDILSIDTKQNDSVLNQIIDIFKKTLESFFDAPEKSLQKIADSIKDMISSPLNKSEYNDNNSGYENGGKYWSSDNGYSENVIDYGKWQDSDGDGDADMTFVVEEGIDMNVAAKSAQTLEEGSGEKLDIHLVTQIPPEESEYGTISVEDLPEHVAGCSTLGSGANIKIDDDFALNATSNSKKLSLENVMTHEMMHAAGVKADDNVNGGDSIMDYSYYGTELTDFDKELLDELYGDMSAEDNDTISVDDGTLPPTPTDKTPTHTTPTDTTPTDTTPTDTTPTVTTPTDTITTPTDAGPEDDGGAALPPVPEPTTPSTGVDVHVPGDSAGEWGDPHFHLTGANGQSIKFDHKGINGHTYNLFSGDGIQINGKYVPFSKPNAPQVVGKVNIASGNDTVSYDIEGDTKLNGQTLGSGNYKLNSGALLTVDGINVSIHSPEQDALIHILAEKGGITVDPEGTFSNAGGIIGKAISENKILSQEECDQFDETIISD